MKKQRHIWGILFVAVLSVIFFTHLINAQVTTEPEELWSKGQYMCKLNGYFQCRESVGVCLSPYSGGEEWEKALDCIDGFNACMNTVWNSCREEHPPTVSE